MKYRINILFLFILGSFYCQNASAQISDSIHAQQKIISPDSIASFSDLILDSTSLEYFEQWTREIPNPCAIQMQQVYVPNCSELIFMNSSWNYPDSNLYCGACIVRYNNLKTGSQAQYPYFPPCRGEPGYPDFNCIGTLLSIEDMADLKILSFYENGKRHGARQYFDENGKQIKTEYYEMGKLVKTITIYSKNNIEYH